MRICLVRCPSAFLIDERAFPPLGLLAVGAGLRGQGHDVTVFDGELPDLPLDFPYYGFGPTSPEYPHALGTMQRIKEVNPQARVILGGPHAILNYLDCGQDGWDSIVVGDGEYAAEEAFLGHRSLIFPESLPLDEYPMPDRSLVDLWGYHFTLNGRRATTVMGSRGCPHHCGYCLPEGTLVLTDDLRWVRIENIHKDDLLLGTRKSTGNTEYVRTCVTDVFTRRAPLMKITTTHGTVYSTKEHPWLTTHNRWIKANKLRVGQCLRNVSPPTETLPETDDYMAGYVVGCVLGDGCLKRYKFTQYYKGKGSVYTRHTFRLVGDYEMLDWFLEYANRLNIGVHRQRYTAGVNSPWKCDRAVATGRRSEFEKLEALLDHHPSSEFKRGWLAGFFDAEGGWSGGSLRYWNLDATKLRRVAAYLEEAKFVVKFEKESLRIMGGNSEAIRFLTWVNPKVPSKKKHIFTQHLKSRAKILCIEEQPGDVRVFNLETLCHNFIADGFVTHNCTKNEKKVRLRSAPKLIEELQILVNMGWNAIAFPEDIFILNKARTAAVCEYLKREGLIWRCLVRADLVVKYGADFLKMMTESGCVGVGVGVESGSDRILKIIRKGEDVATMKEAIRMLKAARIYTKGFFIVGLPGENEESLAETDKFLEEARLNDVDIKIFQPYKGSPIYDHKERYDIEWDDIPLENTFYKGKPSEYYGNVRTSALTTERIVEMWNYLESKYKNYDLVAGGVMCQV